MDVFALRKRVIEDYRNYVRSFVVIKDDDIREHVDRAMDARLLWPEPLILLNPAFEPGDPLEVLPRRSTRRQGRRAPLGTPPQTVSEFSEGRPREPVDRPNRREGQQQGPHDDWNGSLWS